MNRDLIVEARQLTYTESQLEKNLTEQKRKLNQEQSSRRSQIEKLNEALKVLELLKLGQGGSLGSFGEATVHEFWIDLPNYKGSIKGLSAKVSSIVGATQFELEVTGQGIAWSTTFSADLSSAARSFRDIINARATTLETVERRITEQQARLETLQQTEDIASQKVRTLEIKIKETETAIDQIKHRIDSIQQPFWDNVRADWSYYHPALKIVLILTLPILAIAASAQFLYGFFSLDTQHINKSIFIFSFQILIIFVLLLHFATKFSHILAKTHTLKKITFLATIIAPLVAGGFILDKMRDNTIDKIQAYNEAERALAVKKAETAKTIDAKKEQEEKELYERHLHEYIQIMLAKFKENPQPVLDKIRGYIAAENWDSAIHLAKEFEPTQNKDLIRLLSLALAKKNEWNEKQITEEKKRNLNEYLQQQKRNAALEEEHRLADARKNKRFLHPNSLVCISKEAYQTQTKYVAAGYESIVDGCLKTPIEYEIIILDYNTFSPSKIRIIESNRDLWTDAIFFKE